MKKLIILMTFFLLCSSLFPAQFLAADTEKDTIQESTAESDEYNEFGIKKGTMVHGEDISELSEEELQYIPEGWRDGVFEDGHGHAEGEGHEEEVPEGAMTRSAYQNVNDYIAKNKFTTAKIEYDYKPAFLKMNYRGGYGKVEGVVAHETANDSSTIINEIDYMTRNWQNAFVHAFVDHERIIEIHPTNYSVWGAGRYGNERFAQVELVRVHTFDKFARSIDNYATYVASILYKNKLGVSTAKATSIYPKDGTGTLWSHSDVTKILGGTTHVDPHGYFAKYGYNWSEFVELVQLKYKQMAGTAPVTPVSAPKETTTSKLGHIKSATVKIYPKLTESKSFTAGTTYTHAVYYIKKQAVMNGVTYYLLSKNPSSTTGVVGWAKASDISAQTHVTVDKIAKTFYVKGTGSAYTKAWGGSQDYFYKSLVNSTDKEFKVNLTEKVGSTIWHRGVVNGKTVWIEEKNLKDTRMSNTSKLGHIKSTAVKIYPDLANLSKSITAGTTYTHAVYYIKKEAVKNGVPYYLLSKNPSSTTGVVGWAKASDISAQTHVTVDKNAKTFYVKGTGSAYTKAWGGSQDYFYKSLANSANHEFKVFLTEKVGSAIWYRGIVNGKTVWIEAKNLLTEQAAVKTSFNTTSKLGHIKNSDVKIYPNLEDVTKTLTAGSTYTHAVYYIKKEAVKDSERYYLLSKNPSTTSGVVGWAKASDISVQAHVGVDKTAKTFYFKGTGKAYSKAWGGSKDLVASQLGSYENKEFKINLTEKVGESIWYRGVIDGKTAWVHSKDITQAQASRTSKLGHLNSTGVKIYPNIDDLAYSITAGTTYTHAVYYIKKEAVLNGVTYYLLSNNPSSTSGVVGWAKASDISAQTHVTIDKTAKTFYIKGTGSGYSKAWGGSKDYVYQSLSSFQNQTFKVNLTEKVGSAIWYRGTLNGKTVWIHQTSLNTNR
ncbi:N-acetylmuramoyl-L-alanine amidase family protein [Planomicrobium sp. CPCC 101079]|uniref:peptidoglycan recognition protein family protein n=1 Tax=Planomicrobium sp. CPCC 101079 TaxID=2599618 RepID=UPI0011B5C50F|nr:GW dipeptide domain-containing protein [Planomicrobium sp. CPCC 101079]TWT03577.1 hypothetical protein FQV28_11190 [Planomicrobium sp. CPCC 101079]